MKHPLHGKNFKVMNQLVLHKPTFVILNEDNWKIDVIRETLYYSYEQLVESDIFPSIEELLGDGIPLENVYNQIASFISFGDEHEYDRICDTDDIEHFYATYNRVAPKITHDIQEILMMDVVCFYDERDNLRNIPLVKVW